MRNAAGYSPSDMVTQLLDGSADVMAYVGVGVAGGLALFCAFLGIRAGFRFFQGLVWDRRANSWTDEDERLDREYMARADEIINAPDMKYDPDRGWH
jgi:hypothetical protein